jgi:hypothetical protein
MNMASVTTAQMLRALHDHYRKPGEERSGEILITEVEAPGSTRRCDLVRIGMWASRGTGIDVHEIKISRSDWLRELEKPDKAEAWWPYCNRFWVAAPPGIIDTRELPEGWGLMELPAAGRRRFRIQVKATHKKAELTAPLMVELLRRADNDRLAEIQRLRSEHRDEIWKISHEREVAQAKRGIPYEVQQRLDLLERVEAALGVPLKAHSGYPKLPAQDVTPEELAVLFADARDQVSALRRIADAERLLDHLTAVANSVLTQAERSRQEGAAA